MAMYDFKCAVCEKTEEHWFKPTELPEEVDCSCGAKMTYKPTFWYASVTHAQRFTPIVIHRDEAGNIRYPGNVNAPVPEGFHKVEITNFHEARKLEKEVNNFESAKAKDHQYNKTRNLEAQLKENREAMKSIVQNFSPKGRMFYEKMRQASDMKLAEFRSRQAKDPNFYIEALSMDASNRERHLDSSNDWGKMGSGRK